MTGKRAGPRPDDAGNPVSRELGFCLCCGYQTLSAARYRSNSTISTHESTTWAPSQTEGSL